jgi:uncharacterized protein
MSEPEIAAMGPVGETTRISAIDAVRGLALLGIFLVNINLFADAFGKFITPVSPRGAGAAEVAAYYLVKVFCESKFYPLFSLLFGMGLALQWDRAAAAGRRFLGAGLRRLGFLCVLGVAHGLLLWYGDILFMYSIAGVVLLLLLRARARTMLVVAGALLVVSVVLSLGMGALSMMGQAQAEAGAAVEPAGAPEPAQPPTLEPPASEPPFDRFWNAMKEGKIQDGPINAIWVETEREAYRDGPYGQVAAFRAVSWGMFLVFSATGFWWHLMAMFLVGAALLRLGLFTPEKRHWHKRLALMGLLVGLPLAVLTALLPRVLEEKLGFMLLMPMTFLFGPLMSLGYLGAVSWLAESGRARGLVKALSDVGRMALTNYLMQTVIATSIFYYWGLGLFGETTRVERLGIVLGVFACQVALSALWLRHFRFGPMEWLWRTGTYLRVQPIRR